MVNVEITVFSFFFKVRGLETSRFAFTLGC